MTLDRTVVRFAGPLFLFSGLLCAFAPMVFAELAGISATSAGVIELRSVYGGFQLGLGGFLVWCALDDERTTAGLVAFGFVLCDLATVRLLSMAVGAEVTPYLLANFAVEISGAALAGLAYARRHRMAAAVPA